MSEGNGRRKRVVELARKFIESNALIIDTETTGLGDDDVIVEIAIIDAHGTFQFSSLVRPLMGIPPEATAIHGITNEMVGRAATAENLWPLAHVAICGSSLLAYNAPFDSKMLEQTFGPEARDHEWHCLMSLWCEYHGLERWRKLEDVCREINVAPGGHRALGDAMAAREVLRWLARQES